MPKKKSATRKPTLYQQISKRFTKLNNALPEERKLSIERRRQIIKQDILPALSTTSKSKIRVKQIVGLINNSLTTIPTRDPNLCNLNYIHPNQYTLINWYEVDEFLQKRLPDCIYVKVSAGQYGSTKIFNTRNYNYYHNGVQEITENIRKEVNNASGGAWYNGYQILRPSKKNNGEADSYYLDLILFIAPKNKDAEPQAIIKDETRYVGQGTSERREYRKKANKVNAQLDILFNKLQREKARRSRAYRQIRKDNTKLSKIVNKQVSPKNELKRIDDFVQTYQRAMLKINRYLDKGLITQARYDRGVEAIRENFERFNS